MSMDLIADFLTIIRNGVRVAKPFVILPYSKTRHAIAHILHKEGFIRDIAIVEEDGWKKLQLFLKYVDGESVIHDIQRVSKLGRRSYAKHNEIKPVIGGLGLSILTTDRGVISHKQAQKLGVGGEIICTVW